jgi:hypothetical protein
MSYQDSATNTLTNQTIVQTNSAAMLSRCADRPHEGNLFCSAASLQKKEHKQHLELSPAVSELV